MMEPDYAQFTGRQIRALCRSGALVQSTAGVARGYVQTNLVVLLSEDAADFERFCGLNPKPCPLLVVTSPGDYEPSSLASCSDLRTDLPRYRVFRDGECVDRPTSIEKYWSQDCVAFLIGCSFTFEFALLDAGIPVRHIEQGCNVPMYRTNIACKPVGRFRTPMVVSMRPMTAVQAKEAQRITAAFPRVHGAPFSIGDPSALGIEDLSRPDFGDAVSIAPDEIPVFWACGVTPMEAVTRARLDFAITHEPGHMLVTDLHDDSFRED